MTSELLEKRRHGVPRIVLSVISGFLLPVVVLTVLYAVRLHRDRYPHLDVVIDLQVLPGRCLRAGIVGAWLSFLMAISRGNTLSERVVLFLLVVCIPFLIHEVIHSLSRNYPIDPLWNIVAVMFSSFTGYVTWRSLFRGRISSP